MEEKREEKKEEEDLKKIEKEGFEEAEEERKEEERERKRKFTKDELERIEIIKKFAKEVVGKYGPLIRSVVLFGSTARREWKKESDIDIFVIIDDTKRKITPSMKESIEDDFETIARKISDKLSIQQPYLLTEFWRMVRLGHPIVFNFIREGIPVFDRDVFLPIKRLLQMGEIKPSREAVEMYMERAPKRLARVEKAKLFMVAEDCYYAMIETLQAALMFMEKEPPRPPIAAEVMRKTLVAMKLIDEKYADWLEGVINFRKEVEHKKRDSVSGAELDEWIKRAKKFVKEMQKVIVKLEILKRKNIVEKSYFVMNETILSLLKNLGEKVESAEDAKRLFEERFIKTGKISKKYLDVLNRLEEMKKLSDEGKLLEIPKGEVLLHREYVRKFIGIAGKLMRKGNLGS